MFDVARKLSELSRHVAQSDGFAAAVEALKGMRPVTIDGALGSACALSVAALLGHAPDTLVAVVPRVGDVDAFAEDVEAFTGSAPEVFPAWETLPRETPTVDAIFSQRLRVLKALGGDARPRCIVTSIEALMQPVPRREQLQGNARALHVGQSVDLDELMAWLVDHGVERVESVEAPGQFSVRGGVLDAFTSDAAQPVRIDLFGDEIESLRYFDLETQRSVQTIERIELTLLGGAKVLESGTHFADELSRETWIVHVEPAEIVEQGRHYLERLTDPRGLFRVETVLEHLARRATASISVGTQPSGADLTLRVESVDRFSGDVRKVAGELEIVAGRQEVYLACHNEAEQHRIGRILAETALAKQGRLHLCVGAVQQGFRLVDAGIVVLSDRQLFHRTVTRRMPRRRFGGQPIASFLDLNEGDYVAHVNHGIARYRGTQLLEKRDAVEEHLVLEFQEQTKLYVPVSRIELVQKYIGGGGAAPTLSKLGGTSWEHRKQRVERALVDMASEMIALQAAREAKPGIAFPPDTEWQREFEAAFPYVETPDQVETDAEIKSDMERPRPMDRLICGDVGYGKTELAMRAAFKAVDAGKQVAVLVPTTILAEQHYQTFRERMAEYPVEIDVLSRFRSKREQAETLRRMKEGVVDLVIGTHRLVQADVAFHDLGLVIVDEEQRFGVEHKERLKTLRMEVDVLTLTATPIPRTLHLSLLGIRDISNLQTPPQDRLAVETRVTRFDAGLVREAIVRELNRGGQIFFVHNRVESIGRIADQLQEIVPEAIIGIGHGQMNEDELEQAMLDFVNRRSDILVATTIIESGLDIPNANTIFINWADRYGLADLHQLRGRVGRYKHRAYCYLLLDPQRVITPQAGRRLKAIEEYSELGAGFHIAMRDLEIRGAGNILGHQQSGHIAAVGYEMYCQLLQKAVGELKGQPVRTTLEVQIDLPWPAFLPREYVPSQKQKMELYRRLSRLENLDALRELQRELEDRFGPLPAAAEHLLANNELRILCQHWQIAALYLEDRFAVLRYRDRPLVEELLRRSRKRLRIADAESAYWPLVPGKRSGEEKGKWSAEAIYREMKTLLQLRSERTYNAARISG